MAIAIVHLNWPLFPVLNYPLLFLLSQKIFGDIEVSFFLNFILSYHIASTLNNEGRTLQRFFFQPALKTTRVVSPSIWPSTPVDSLKKREWVFRSIFQANSGREYGLGDLARFLMKSSSCGRSFDGLLFTRRTGTHNPILPNISQEIYPS